MMKSDNLNNEFATDTATKPTPRDAVNFTADEIGASKMAAIRSIMTRTELWLCYAGILLLTLVVSLEINLSYTLLPSALGSFTANALTSVLSLAVNALGIFLIPLYSKAADYFGRPETFSLSIISYLLGLIIICSSQNFATFAAGWVINSIGITGYETVKLLLMADLTSLANRANFLAADNVPFVINTWVGALAASPIDLTIGWRWGYGIPAILLVPGAALILLMLFKLQRKAKLSSSQTVAVINNISIREKLRKIAKELDLFGFFLLVGSILMMMLPMVIAGTLPDGWSTPSIIAVEVIGIILFISLIIWEVKFSKHPLIPTHLLRNRTTVGAILLNFFVAIDMGMNWQYLSIYFMISRKIDITYVALLLKGYQVAYMFAAIAAGLLIKRLSEYKKLLIVGTAITCVGIGLTIPARFPHSSDALIVVTQAITGIGSAIVAMCAAVGLQGSVSRKDIAIITATSQMIARIGSSIGNTVAGTVWTQLVPKLLKEYVPGDFDMVKTMGDIGYVWKMPAEQFEPAIAAFGDGQKVISAISCTFGGLAFLVAVFIMQPIDVNSVQKFNDDISSAEPVTKSDDLVLDHDSTSPIKKH